MKLAVIATVAGKDLQEIFRDRLLFSLAFLMPVSMMLLLGFGLSLDVENLPLGVLDYDRSAASREYINEFASSRSFDFQSELTNPTELEQALMGGDLRVALVIPPNFGKNVEAGRRVQVQSIVDGVSPSRAQIIKGYVLATNQAATTKVVSTLLARRGIDPTSITTPLTVEMRYLYNQSLKSIWSLAPKLIMLITMMTAPYLTALVVVREKETGSIYNIYTSTVTRAEYLIGKMLPQVAIASLNAFVLTILAMKLFGAPFKGDPLFYAISTLVYVLCTTGIGLVVSVFVKTQVAAQIVTPIVTMIPAVLYSGVMTPIESLTSSAQVVAHSLPAMYYANIVIGSFLKGVGSRALGGDLAVLTVYALTLQFVGFLLFHKRNAS